VQYWNKKFKKQRVFRAVLFATLLALAFIILTTPSIMADRVLEPGIAQYYIFPFLVLFLIITFVPNKIIPLSVVSLAVLAVGVTSLWSFSLVPTAQSSVALSRLSSDLHEVETTLLRKKLNHYFGEKLSPVARFYRSIDSHREAFKLVSEQPDLKAIIWGNQQQLVVSFAKPSESISSIKLEVPWTQKSISPKLVNYVPAISLSTEPRDATSHFLSYILGEVHQDEGSSLSERQLQQSRLYGAGNILSPWRGLGHLAYPLWRVADLHLQEASLGPVLDRGELGCALELYTQAASRLQPQDNPLLRAAIFNNKGVALLIDGLERGSLDILRSARQHFLHIRLIATHPGAKQFKNKEILKAGRFNSELTRKLINSYRGSSKKKKARAKGKVRK